MPVDPYRRTENPERNRYARVASPRYYPLQCFNETVDGQSDLELTNGVIFLRPLRAEDAATHLAGEDEDMARWLSGGRSTLDNVKAYIERTIEDWRTGAPRRAFGVFDCASGQLIGSIEVNLARILEPAQVNVSYGIHRQWRGLGLAQHALDLMDQYLRASTDARQIVLRIAPANRASIRVAERADSLTWEPTMNQKAQWPAKSET